MKVVPLLGLILVLAVALVLATSDVSTGMPTPTLRSQYAIEYPEPSEHPEPVDSVELGRTAIEIPPPDVAQAEPLDVSALDSRSRRVVERALSAGLLNETTINIFVDETALAELRKVWEAMAEPIAEAKNARKKIGKAVAKERFASGDYQEELVDEKDRQPDGGFKMKRFMKRSHPDEWLSVKMLYREGGGQRIHQVRIPPGELPRFDAATSTLRLAELLRKKAVSRIVAKYQ